MKAKPVLSKRIMHRIVAAAFLTVSAFALIFFIVTKINIESTFYDNMSNTGNIVSGIVSDHLNVKIGNLKKNAANDTIASFLDATGKNTSYSELQLLDGYDEVQEILDDICDTDPDLVSAWIVSEQSGILISNANGFLLPTDYGLSNKYWYRDLMSNSISGEAVCSASSNSIFADNTSVVSIIVPVAFGENDAGFLGAELKIDSLNRILTQYTLNSGSYPIITCNFGTIIYSPENDPDFTNKYDIKKPPLLNLLVQSSSLANGIEKLNDGGMVRDTYYYSDNTAVPGWSIIILFDSAEMNGNLINILWQEIIVVAGLMIILLIFINNIVRREIRLLPEIDDAINSLASGDYSKKIEIDGKGNEMTAVAEKVNCLADTLSKNNLTISNYANNDTLTGLPNRISLYNRIEELIRDYRKTATAAEEAVARAAEAGIKIPAPSVNRFAVMFVDVDNFKWLNETLGHNFGDAVLVTFAEVLIESVGKICNIYRFSGDEFIILFTFGDDYDKIHEIIDMLQRAFEQQIKVLTDNIYLKFSMGVSIYPDDDENADMLLRDADVALHRAKDSGKDRVSFYTNAVQKTTLSKAVIAQKITNALKNDELYLNFQPIISTKNGAIHGFEELLRWNSADFGNIPPAEFINIAEESGAIVQIGMWIFEKSCRFVKELCEKYNKNIVMSINVSPVQFKRSDYLDHVKRVLEITQVNPANIQIEITESTLVDFAGSDNSIINELNNLGIAIALDDFGTGYSSLNYLKNFPIKCLKIDKSFIDEINKNKRDYTITDSIIDLVHSLGIQTIAEGIETVGQYNFLVRMKCDYIQGFLVSKPLNEADAAEFVKMYDEMHRPDKHKLEEHERQLAVERKENARLKAIDSANEKHDDKLHDGTISK